MSRTLAANLGSLDSLKVRIRCGAKPWARQMRWTEVRLTPAILAITRPGQWVVSPGGCASVRAPIRSAISSASLGTRRAGLVAQQAINTFGHEPLLPAP